MTARAGPPVAARDRAGLVTAAAGAVVAAAVLVSPPGDDRFPLGSALAAWLLLATWVAVVDAREHRIPNRLVAGLALAGSVGLGGAMVGGLAWTSVAAGLLVALAVAMATLVLHVVTSGAVGMGDVKLAFPVVLVLSVFGARTMWWTLVVTVGLMAAVVFARLVRRRAQYPLPLAPFLVAGTGTALVLT